LHGNSSSRTEIFPELYYLLSSDINNNNNKEITYSKTGAESRLNSWLMEQYKKLNYDLADKVDCMYKQIIDLYLDCRAYSTEIPYTCQMGPSTTQWRILSNLLSERTTHLNNIIQENLTVKSELDKSLITNQKNEQKLEFYEEQFNLYKASNENYQKIIQELKDQIAQLNLNITQIQKTNEEDKEQAEKDYQNNLKIELDHNKKEIEDLYENKIKEEKEIHDQKIDEMLEHIKTLEEKNDELSNELNKKNNNDVTDNNLMEEL